MLQFACIQNFELILDILEDPKLSISGLKQAASLLFGKNSTDIVYTNLSAENKLNFSKLC